YAEGATAGSRVAWIVVEAKDEPGATALGAARTKLFAEKAKYITADTAFFVMVDPVSFVARSTGPGQQNTPDIEITWAG
ncbi:hypothetical protein ACSLVN_27975, partial [Klebsiella pneumoniae]|uniref:hypothetical protein n=1 Tax=Klebsiella pneumoniae TaxID=573 RepID=UPI003EE01717